MADIKILNRPGARLVLLAIVAAGAIAGAAITSYVHTQHDPYKGSRQVAELTLKALSKCDIDTAKKYYIPFQEDEAQAASYQNSCDAGVVAFSYNTRTGASTRHVEGKEIKNVSYIYDVKKSGSNGQITVYAVWSSANNKWQVFKAEAIAAKKPAATKQL